MKKKFKRYKKPLSVTHPDIAKQWHPTKNENLTPNDVTAGSHKKVWWKCDEEKDHKWEAAIKSRVMGGKSKNGIIIGTGCPCCSGRMVVKSNCLETTHYDISKQLHPTKNGKLTSKDVTAGSRKKVWWKCDKEEDHEYISRIADKVAKHINCPCCSGRIVVKSNCLATIHPDIAKQWHPTKNGKLTPFDVVTKSSIRVWWKCDKEDDHEWQAAIAERSVGNGCSCCYGRTVVISNCLATTHPEIAKQWHLFKNGNLTPFSVVAGSKKKFWWKCNVENDHEWESAVADRVSKNSGCPCCYGRKVVKSNCLAITHPGIAKQWHPIKNGNLTPFDVCAGSNKKFWWKCIEDENHEWDAVSNNRTRKNNGSDCPWCKETKGEKLIRKFLEKNRILYIPQETFNSCRGKKRPLPFDFYIPNIRLLIEYDGEQHYRPVRFNGMSAEKAKQQFKQGQKRDKIKTKYAKNNNIKLLRIPYTEFDNIESILEKHIL